MIFIVDPRISSTSFWVGDLPLSRLYIKNDANFPWLILVPQLPQKKEIYELTVEQQHQLMHEICQVSQALKSYTKPDKLNVGALGNIVDQLHIHVIARFQHDRFWPHSVWQEAASAIDYEPNQLQELLIFLRKQLNFNAI